MEAAVAGTLPNMVVATALQGDLHVHTSRTDGSATMIEMAGAAGRVGPQVHRDHGSFKMHWRRARHRRLGSHPANR